MLFTLEIIMFIVGIQVLLKRRVPPFLYGGRRYTLGKPAIRLIGAILVLPFPVTVLGSILLASLLGEKVGSYDVGLELACVVAAAVAVPVVIRRMRRRKRRTGSTRRATKGSASTRRPTRNDSQDR